MLYNSSLPSSATQLSGRLVKPLIGGLSQPSSSEMGVVHSPQGWSHIQIPGTCAGQQKNYSNHIPRMIPSHLSIRPKDVRPKDVSLVVIIRKKESLVSDLLIFLK